MKGMFFLLGLLGYVLSFKSEASLLVAPTRVSLSDTQRVTTVALRHLGKRTGKYRVSLIFNRMLEDGSLKEVTDIKAEERAATKMIRFSPRLAILEPNVEQVVRVMVIAPKDLSHGEYRAHLLFDPSDDTEGELSTQKTAPQGNNIGMHLEAKVSVAVPVVFTHGKIVSNLILENPKLVRSGKGELGVAVTIVNQGNGFPRGDVVATQKIQGKPPKLIAELRGIPVYSSKVTFRVPVEKKIDFRSLNQGTIHVEFRERSDRDANLSRTLAFVEAPINK